MVEVDRVRRGDPGESRASPMLADGAAAMSQGAGAWERRSWTPSGRHSAIRSTSDNSHSVNLGPKCLWFKGSACVPAPVYLRTFTGSGRFSLVVPLGLLLGTGSGSLGDGSLLWTASASAAAWGRGRSKSVRGCDLDLESDQSTLRSGKFDAIFA